MKIKPSRFTLSLLLAGSVLFTFEPSHAAIKINASEVGDDVVLSGSGSLNLNAWTKRFGGVTNNVVSANSAQFQFAGSGGAADTYSNPLNFNAPSNFGPGGSATTGVGSGDSFGLWSHNGTFGGVPYDGPLLFVPESYVPGSTISLSMTFEDTDLFTLGIGIGTYVWSWGTGGDADSVTLETGAPAVIPEPTTFFLLGLGALFLGVRRNRAARR